AALSAEDQSAILFYDGYRNPRHLGREPQRVAKLQVLPLRVNGFGIDDFTAHEILGPRVAVESTAPLADLDNPRPDAFGRCLDGDGAGGGGVGLRNHQVSGETPRPFVRRGSPPQEPGAERQRVECGTGEARSNKG